jgi:hypothetical protein
MREADHAGFLDVQVGAVPQIGGPGEGVGGLQLGRDELAVVADLPEPARVEAADQQRGVTPLREAVGPFAVCGPTPSQPWRTTTAAVGAAPCGRYSSTGLPLRGPPTIVSSTRRPCAAAGSAERRSRRANAGILIRG